MEEYQRRALPGLPVGDGTSVDLGTSQFSAAHRGRPAPTHAASSNASMAICYSFVAVRKGKCMAIVTLGIDLAKNVFAMYGVDAKGRAVLVRPASHAPSCRSLWSRRRLA